MLALSHKNLEVYRMSLRMVQEVYRVTKLFPIEEKYTLVSQIRRAALSVCSNIAEGCSRTSKREKMRFYEISRSSLVEMDTHFEISALLNFYSSNPASELERIILSIFKMLSKMIDNLKLNPH
jgi:four helix bundle protein